jgi:hypothetical protein
VTALQDSQRVPYKYHQKPVLPFVFPIIKNSLSQTINHNPLQDFVLGSILCYISLEFSRSMGRITSVLILLLGSFFSNGQEALKQRPSPLSITSVKYKDCYLKITYSQPHKHSREIFGKLVPYGDVWRTGANEATEITATKNIELNSKLLKAGTYSIFTIPEKENWTIIINSELGLWGSYNYNPKLDVMRLEVPAKINTTPYEAFTINIRQINEKATLEFLWDDVRVDVPIKFIN